MNLKLRYLLGAVLSIPLLPIMYFQSRKVRKIIPSLPEARGTEGIALHKSDRKINIIILGESTMAGVGVDTNEEGFTGSLARKLSELIPVNVHWKVYAESGSTAKNVRLQILPKITEKELDLIVIGLGANDSFTLNRPWKWRSEIEAIINDLRKKFPDSAIAFTNMPPIKEFPAFTALIKFTIGNLVELHGEELKKITTKYKNVFYNPEILKVPEWNKKLGGNYTHQDFFSDGVHPSKLTYQVWGKDFANFLVDHKIL